MWCESSREEEGHLSPDHSSNPNTSRPHISRNCGCLSYRQRECRCLRYRSRSLPQETPSIGMSFLTVDSERALFAIGRTWRIASREDLNRCLRQSLADATCSSREDLSYNLEMIRLHCSGLSNSDLEELQTILTQIEGVDNVTKQPDLAEPGQGMQSVSPEFWLIINEVNKHKGTQLTESPWSRTTGFIFGKVLMWWRAKENRGGEISLYDTDGSVIGRMRNK